MPKRNRRGRFVAANIVQCFLATGCGRHPAGTLRYPFGFSAELGLLLPLPDATGAGGADAGDLAQGFLVQVRYFAQVVGVGQQLEESYIAGIASQCQQTKTTACRLAWTLFNTRTRALQPPATHSLEHLVLSSRFGHHVQDVFCCPEMIHEQKQTAPSRSTRRMMQMTGAAFQAQANLKEQVTDPTSHIPARESCQIKRCLAPR